VHWTNAVGSVASLVLSVYLWRHADELAEDEAKLFGVGRRMEGFRAKYKMGSAFLAILGLALLGAGLR
jgi:hypothetical protein